MAQESREWAFLTCREVLMYAAQLFHGGDTASASVDTLLDVMGLSDCADTKVGNAFIQGLSGGQKKRLSLAVGLLNRPVVLFADEPTSGLDEASCAAIMRR
jgi:ATP-binding cassette subfamily G (WHITE) protein 2